MTRENIFKNLITIKKRGNLNCPDCVELMYLYSCNDVIIDKCNNCQGIWFDNKEFGAFKRTLDSYDLSKLEIHFKPENEETILSSCPRCSVLLNEMNYGYKSGVTFKKCNSCEGLWLPIKQTVSLIELAKIGQEIAPHASGIADAYKKQEESRRKSDRIGNMGRILNQRVYYFGRYFPSMIPLYDINPRNTFPLVTLGLIAINILVYFLMASSDQPLSDIYQAYAMQPSEISELESTSTLVSSMFMHAGVFHLLGNLFFLWTFGDNVEEVFGKFKFLIFYLFFGFAASMAHIWIHPDSIVPALGASGAISGVLGAYLCLFPHVNIKTLIYGYLTDVPAWIYLGLWIFIQLASAFFYDFEGGVAWWAHIGGFITGYIITFYYKRRLTLVNSL